MRNDNNTKIAKFTIFNGGIGRRFFKTDAR